jgi:SAM-dependent methyltransferase
MNSDIDESRKRFWESQTFDYKPNDWFNNEIENALGGFAIFNDKNVLEIGPGAGRQFSKLYPWCKSYHVADISQEILDKKIYSITDRHLIHNYDCSLGNSYDIITFWFVIHHVLPSELNAFIRFIRRHLYVDGFAIFNSPIRGINENLYNDDGIKTSSFKNGEVFEAFVDQGFRICYNNIYGINEAFICQRQQANIR